MPNLARWRGVLFVTIWVSALGAGSGRAEIFNECGDPVDLEQWDPTAAFVSPRCKLIAPPFQILNYRIFSDSADVLVPDGAESGITGSLPAGRASRLEAPAGSQTNLSLPQPGKTVGHRVRGAPLISDRDDPNGFFDQLGKTPIASGMP